MKPVNVRLELSDKRACLGCLLRLNCDKFVCGLVIGRGLNAAINLRNREAGCSVSVCGVLKQSITLVVDGTMNQEVNFNVQHCISLE
jgi:hypothetical protein